jgi:hypothetical protein
MTGVPAQGVYASSRTMKMNVNPTWEHFKLLLFTLFLCELVLFLITPIFGRAFVYNLALATCFYFGIIAALCYALIVCTNLGGHLASDALLKDQEVNQKTTRFAIGTAAIDAQQY